MSEQLSNMKDQAKILSTFLDSPVWKMLDALYAEQVHLRQQNVLLTPLRSADSIYEQEFQKGEATGIELARNLPTNVLESLIVDIKREEEENAPRRYDNDSDTDDYN